MTIRSWLAHAFSPIFETRATISAPDAALLGLFGALPSIAGVTVSPTTAMRSPAVRRAVGAIAETVGTLPCLIYERDASGAHKPAESHPAFALLHRDANPWTPSPRILEQVVRDACLHGNGYLYVNRANGEPRELIHLRPETVQVAYDMLTSEPILGNIKQESGFNPLSRNPNDAGPGLDSWGLAQWNRGRFANLKSFAANQGKPWQDYETQLGFVHHEIQTTPYYRNALRTRDGGGFGHAYEGFGDDTGPTRTRYSEDFLKKFGGRKIAEVDMTPTGSIAKQGQDAAKKAAEQASQAQQKLADQLARASQSTQQITAPLQSMDAGVGKLTGSLAQGVPATEGFAGELEKLIQQLLSGLGGGGGGLGGIGEALGGMLGFADGGHVSGPGGPTSDSIPAMLSNGEFVVNAKAAGKHGALLEMINSGKAPRFAVGGFVGGTSLAHATTYAPSTTINLTGSGNPKQDAVMAAQVKNAVGAALAAHMKADTFRRGGQQQMAAAFRAMSRAHIRNG